MTPSSAAPRLPALSSVVPNVHVTSKGRNGQAAEPPVSPVKSRRQRAGTRRSRVQLRQKPLVSVETFGDSSRLGGGSVPMTVLRSADWAATWRARLNEFRNKHDAAASAVRLRMGAADRTRNTEQAGDGVPCACVCVVVVVRVLVCVCVASFSGRPAPLSHCLAKL